MSVGSKTAVCKHGAVFSCVELVCVLLQPEQITRRRWLRFLPFWLSGCHPVNHRILVLPKGSILPVPCAQDCSFHPAFPPTSPWSGLHGAHDWGGLQLPLRQQLRPLLPSHAALHERPSTHMRGSQKSVQSFAKDSCECFLDTLCPKSTAIWIMFVTNVAHFVNPLKPRIPEIMDLHLEIPFT